ncbi:hypothetical protein V8J88_07935 [Massilia sp. W12]|uniref:hypothetical protein n=1 Tax=Massilia sp. W12 TaxID=3126507 RepID=UPI0030D4815C
MCKRSICQTQLAGGLVLLRKSIRSGKDAVKQGYIKINKFCHIATIQQKFANRLDKIKKGSREAAF